MATVRRLVPRGRRQRVLARDGGRCCRCGVAVQHQAHVDHVVPLGAGGGNDLANLQLLCAGCHAGKTADEAALPTVKPGGCLVCGQTPSAACPGPPFAAAYYRAGGPCVPVTAAQPVTAIPPGFRLDGLSVSCVACRRRWPHTAVAANAANLAQHRRSRQCTAARQLRQQQLALRRFVRTRPPRRRVWRRSVL